MRFIEMFAGVGGFRLGLEPLGLRCAWANDIDPDACEVYRRRHGDIVEGDIAAIPSRDIPDHDILTAGFPCQPFSRGGANLGFDDTRGTLFFEVARVLRDKRPKLAVLENVRDMLTHDRGRTFRTVAAAIRECGYQFDFAILSSADFGVAQKRERVYIVAAKCDMRLRPADEPPRLPPSAERLRELAGVSSIFRRRQPGARVTLGSVQPKRRVLVPEAVESAVRAKLGERPASLVRIRDVRTGFQSVPTWTVGLFGAVSDEDTAVLESMRRGHQAVMWDAMAGKSKPGKTWIKAFRPEDPEERRRLERLADMGYVRRRDDGYSLINRNILPGGLPSAYGGPAAVAPTLTASNLSCFGVVREDGVYELGPAEFEWLQGFPVGFTDIGLGDRKRMRLLGNAVTPSVARHAASTLLDALDAADPVA